MEINQYIDLVKNIEEQILDYINDESLTDEQLGIIFDFDNIDNMTMNEILHLIVKIVNNIHRTPSFPQKVTSIILHLKKFLLQNFTNFEIFSIFKDSSYLLFIIFNEKIITPTRSMLSIITKNEYQNENYCIYLFKEFNSFLLPNSKKKMYRTVGPFLKEGEEKYEFYRKTGENHSYIATLIRNDLVEEFVSYVSKTNLSLNSKIPPSIFETNKFLISKAPSLIEYAAFFGSIQILKYLAYNNVELVPSLWLYSIHGNNAEIIQYIEDNNVIPNQKSYKACIHEALKCHHYEIANYILDIFVKNQYVEDFNYYDKLLKYSCYVQFDDEFIEKSLPFRSSEIIRYKYSKLFDIFFKLKMIDINSITILYS